MRKLLIQAGCIALLILFLGVFSTWPNSDPKIIDPYSITAALSVSSGYIVFLGIPFTLGSVILPQCQSED